LGASTTYYRDIHCLDLDSVIEGEYGLDGAEPLRIPLPHSTFTADMHALVYEAFEEALGFGMRNTCPCEVNAFFEQFVYSFHLLQACLDPRRYNSHRNLYP
jgi:hypothetical protein